MKCPYCIAEIDDQAVVCSHCSHDLFFIRPLLERLAAVEGRLARAEDALSQLAAAASAPVREGGASRDAPFRVAYLAVVVVAALLGTACFYYYKDRGGHVAFLWASAIIPFPAGVVLGTWWPGRHAIGYVLAGLLVGAANLVVGNLAPSIGRGWGVGAGLLVVGVGAMFVSGGLIGDWLEQRLEQGPASSRLARRIAASLSAGAGPSREDREKRLAELLTAVEKIAVPIAIALIGALAQAAAKP